MVKVDLTGRRYGLLVVQSYAGIIGRAKHWNCLCDCGSITMVNHYSLIHGRSQSCGCQRGGPRHKDCNSSEYSTWMNMRDRCLNKNSPAYKYYGARGIRICERWNRYEDFLSDMGRKPDTTYSIDRIDNARDYEPANCRWATKIEQAQNRRSKITKLAKFLASSSL